MPTTMDELIWKLTAQGASQAEAEINRVDAAVNKLNNSLSSLNVRLGSMRSVRGSIGGAASGSGGGGGGPSIPIRAFTGGGGGVGGNGIGNNIAAGGMGGTRGALTAQMLVGGFILGAAVTGVIALGKAISDGMEEATRFARNVLNLQQLTGGTTREAAALTSFGGVAGISDTQTMREMVTMTRRMMTAQGGAAMGALGVHPGRNQDATQVFDQTISGLRRLPDGIRKTRLEMEAFGPRVTMAIQPLLRATDEQWQLIQRMNKGVDEDMLHSIDRFSMSIDIFKETLFNRVLIPLEAGIAKALTPVLNKGIEATDFTLDALRRVGRNQRAFEDKLGPFKYLLDPFASDPNAKNGKDKQQKTNDILTDMLGLMKSQTIGGGPRFHSVTSQLEVEFAVMNAFSGKGGIG